MAKTNFFFASAALIAADQFSKYFVSETSLPVIKNAGFFNAPITAGLFMLFTVLYFRFFRAVSLGFVLISSGAISNLADRIYFGYARDFINLGFSTMNLADIMIWTGIILLLFYVKKGL